MGPYARHLNLPQMGGVKGAAAVTLIATSSAASNICGTNITIGRSVAASVNLTYPGLEAVAAAVDDGDYGAACEALATYYLTSNTSSWLRIPPVAPGSGLAGGFADAIVFNDTYFFEEIDLTTKVPRNADGGLDWLYKGPRNDVECMNDLNRHEGFGTLLGAWRKTGNPIYPRYVDATIKDWVTHLPCPNALSRGSKCVPLGLNGTTCSWAAEDPVGAQACDTSTLESPWRSLEMGLRMGGAWPVAFFGFQGAAEFSTSARALMILGIAQHFSALAVDGGHAGRGTPNWVRPMSYYSPKLCVVVRTPAGVATYMAPNGAVVFPVFLHWLFAGDDAVAGAGQRSGGVSRDQQRVGADVAGPELPW